MTFNPLTLVLTILGGLIVAGILGWVRKPRLCILVPRMFSYSQLTDKGQLVELTVFNRGFKTEESIEVTLNPSLKYEMLGASSQDATLVKNKLVIYRLGSSDEIAVILVVENRVFKNDDIVQCLSKDTKGTIASKLELVPMTASQRVALLAWLVFIAAVFYGLNSGVDYFFKSSQTSSNIVVNTDGKLVNVNGWKVNKIYSNDNSLFKNMLEANVIISVRKVEQKKDVVEFEIKFENKTNGIIQISSMTMTTTKSEEKIPSYERYVHDLRIFPSKIETRRMKVIIPEKPTDVSEKTVFVEAMIVNDDGETLPLRQDFLID
jgi:hypothetical protein